MRTAGPEKGRFVLILFGHFFMPVSGSLGEYFEDMQCCSPKKFCFIYFLFEIKFKKIKEHNSHSPIF